MTGEDTVLRARTYRGRSEHPILRTWDGAVDVLALDFTVQMPWWKKVWQGSPTAASTFIDLVWSLFEQDKGQSVLVEVRPVPEQLDLRRLETYGSELEAQVEQSSSVKTRTKCPSREARWPENIFCEQYIFDISEKDRLFPLIDRYRRFGMMTFLILNVDARLDECARQLQKGFLDEPFDLEEIVEALNVIAYFDWLGEHLIMESPRKAFLERFVESRHIEQKEILEHPLKKGASHSLWLGNRRILP